MHRSSEEEPKNPVTLTLNPESAATSNAETSVLSSAHLRSTDMASLRDMVMFRLYVEEFGPELAKFFAREHHLQIDLGV